MTEYVVLVDENDSETGTAEKLEAHEKGLLHRAVSIMLFQKENPNLVLLQQRAASKYHSPLMWANACCSHPRQGESTEAAAVRRVREELGLGLNPADLIPAGTFTYRAQVGNLVEHELDHLFICFIENKSIPFNPAEVASVEWVELKTLLKDLSGQPFRKYVPWLDKVVYKTLESTHPSIRKVAV